MTDNDNLPMDDYYPKVAPVKAQRFTGSPEQLKHWHVSTEEENGKTTYRINVENLKLEVEPGDWVVEDYAGLDPEDYHIPQIMLDSDFHQMYEKR